MKLQDVIFAIVYSILLIKNHPRMLVVAGIVCLLLAIPLYTFWVFFTAQRLVIYSAVFFLSFTLISLLTIRKVQ